MPAQAGIHDFTHAPQGQALAAIMASTQIKISAPSRAATEHRW